DDDGTPVGLRGILVDISAEKRAEEEPLNYQRHMSTLASELSLAEERVRRHTAMELHDSVAQILAFVKIKLGVLRKSVPEVPLKTGIDEVLALVEEAIANTRGILSELVSPILYEMGLVPAIEWLAQRFRQRHDLDIEVQKDKELEPLPFDVKVLLFQIVRELLLNVVKHANARKALVKIDHTGQILRIFVEDDGSGFEFDNISPGRDAATHFGFFSIRVRLESIGGKFRVRTRPGHGTRAILSVPFSSDEEKRKGAGDDHQDSNRG
ncbi:MAG: sensor histidine kinase, partial [Deltaproteobacteria bacterium]|nr:sensor histidine kinase [Deltaproteobacteria bacterium]